MDLGRYGFREVMNLQIYTLVGATPTLYWPFANTSNIEMSSDVTYATGGSGAPRRISYFGAKTGTLTVETEIFDMNVLSLLTGTDVATNSTSDIFKVENLPVSAGLTVTTTNTPITSPAPAVYKFVNGTKSSVVSVSSTVGKVITLTGVAEGDIVQVFYQWTTTNQTFELSIKPDKFPPFVKIVGDTFFTDEISGDLVDGQFVFYKARVMPKFTISSANSGEPTKISLVFDLFAYDKSDGTTAMLDVILYAD